MEPQNFTDNEFASYISEDILDAAVAATPEIVAEPAHFIDDFIENLMDTSSPTTDIPNETADIAKDITVENPVQEVQMPEIAVVEEPDPVTARFSSAVWFEEIQKQEICLAGLGGIGSYVAFLLSRMHPARITMFDMDTIEEVNLAGQLFRRSDVGQPKCTAIARAIQDYSDYYAAAAICDRFVYNTTFAPVMICGFDNMQARKDFYQTWRDHVVKMSPEEAARALFIDGRLSAEAFQVIAIQGDNKDAFTAYEERFLFDDSKADATVCSYKQTTYMANMIGSMMVNIFTNWVANLAGEFRPVPFFTEYDASIINFKIEM